MFIDIFLSTEDINGQFMLQCFKTRMSQKTSSVNKISAKLWFAGIRDTESTIPYKFRTWVVIIPPDYGISPNTEFCQMEFSAVRKNAE